VEWPRAAFSRRPASPADGTALARASRVALALATVVGVLAPALAWAHERWVPHATRSPVNRAYFRTMRGEALRFSLGASAALVGVVVIWYLISLDVVWRITPVTEEAKAREARRGLLSRTGRAVARFLLDADVDNRFTERGLAVGAFVFGRLPAFVLLLGVHQRWLLMPSFPLSGPLALPLRCVAAGLAVWVLVGRYLRALGITVFAVFVYLCFAYGIAAIDAIPVLASAAFYYYARERHGADVNARQILGIRLSLGIGFFLLGLINKIYLADLFIGVGDQHPALLQGPQTMFPGLTREAFSFATALGEMTFGLLLLLGIFDKLTTLALSLIFVNFMLTFGWAEIVHLYPISGFSILFFRGPPGTLLDGAVFRTHVALWRWAGHRSSPLIYATAVVIVAVAAAALLIFLPLFLVVHVVPRIGG